MGDTKLNYTEYQEFFFRHAKFKKPTKYTEILRMKYVYPEIRDQIHRNQIHRNMYLQRLNPGDLNLQGWR